MPRRDRPKVDGCQRPAQAVRFPTRRRPSTPETSRCNLVRQSRAEVTDSDRPHAQDCDVVNVGTRRYHLYTGLDGVSCEELTEDQTLEFGATPPIDPMVYELDRSRCERY